jgi:anti-anti-sigma factor
MSTENLAAEVVPVQIDDRLSHVALRGHFDIERTQRIELHFTAQVAGRHRPAIVDLSEATFLSSYAIGILISASRALRNRGPLLVLLRPGAEVAKVLAASRLHLAMPIAASVDEARTLIEAR